MEIANWYSVAKALHLIGMVSWMSGLFYLVRLMVYHAEAFQRPEPERDILLRQFNLMEWKVYKIILKPAVVITWSFGTIMVVIQPVWLEQTWFYGKMILVILFSVYTHYCRSHILLLENKSTRFGHAFYRAMNEVPTLILVAAVFLAVFRDRINWWYLLLGMGVFSALIGLAIRRVARRS